MPFEVIGDDEDEDLIIGAYDDDEDDIEGDVMGYGGPMDDDDDVEGYDEYDEPIIMEGDVIGARRRRRRRRRRRPRSKRRRLVRVRKPGWRARQLAPGVIAPDQGMLPLPLGDVTFNLATQTHTFEGQIQKPFRGERLLVSTVRTGTSAVGRLIGQLFVGTDLQQLDVPGFDLEQVGDPAAFGVRLTMKPAQPGVFIRIVTALSSAIAGTDTIYATVTLLGRNVH